VPDTVVSATILVAPVRKNRRRGLSYWIDNEKYLGYMLVAPVVLLLLGLVAYPFAVAIGYALSDRTLADPGVFVGFDNFIELFDNQIYLQTLRNTFIFTAGSVTMRLFFGVGLALLLNEHMPFRRFIRAAILLPWIVPTVLGTMAWL
jgi:multiple sugar transport system permease protein